MMCGGVGRSGSPMPMSIRSDAAGARLALVLVDLGEEVRGQLGQPARPAAKLGDEGMGSGAQLTVVLLEFG